MVLSVRKLLWATAAGCVFTLLLFFHALDPLAGLIHAAVDPFERFFIASSSGIRGWFIARDSLLAERDALRATLQEFYQQVQDAESCRKENEELRTLLAYHPPSRVEAVIAQMVNFANMSRTRITIDKGLRDGIEKGDAVVVGNGILTGRVVNITDDHATVALLTDTAISVAAALAGERGSEGVVRSRRGALFLDFIPQDKDIELGSMVVTAASDERIPPYLTIGYVAHVETDKSAPFQSARIEQSLSEYAFVSVLHQAD
ncbi:MAG: rod shape-determining protein MreC [Patescibacteria group bacterium]